MQENLLTTQIPYIPLCYRVRYVHEPVQKGEGDEGEEEEVEGVGREGQEVVGLEQSQVSAR